MGNVKTDIKQAITLLEIANCPNCDGSGVIPCTSVFSDHDGQPLADMEQCQWCAERSEVVSDFQKEEYEKISG